MMKKRVRLGKITENIRFRERMLLIYIIGGIIPFVIASLYSNSKSLEYMLRQNKKMQLEEIRTISSSIRESMGLAEDVSDQIYENRKLRVVLNRLSQKAYKDTSDFEKDSGELNFIDTYMKNYKNEISSIKIYVKNATITAGKYISYVSGTDMQKMRWYLPTFYRYGENYWAYDYDLEKSKKRMQVSRAIQNDEGAVIGVLTIQLSPQRTLEKMTGRQINSVVTYAGDDIIETNFEIGTEESGVLEKVEGFKKKRDFQKIGLDYGEYLVTYDKIYPDSSDAHFTLVSMQDYQSIMSDFGKISAISFSTVLVGMLLSVGLTVLFSNLFGKRISALRRQMHYVAVGEYEKVQPIQGNDEVGILYRELEQMMHDIQELTGRVVEEKVQKEKMHTKQKEVEFKMLASQINPHFLYNTLETIRMKAKINKEPEIEELVKMLAKIMRRNIQVKDQMVTLESEIELIKNYLVIQGYRFGDRIRSRVVVDPDVEEDIMVIPLIIQPFVENAYAHGLESKEKDGELLIHVAQKEEIVEITVKDNGVGMDYYRLGKLRHRLKTHDNEDGSHIGVVNVHQRLQILYGDSYGVRVESRENIGTTITIRFPKEKENPEQEK